MAHEGLWEPSKPGAQADRQARRIPVWPVATAGTALTLFLFAPRADDLPAAVAAFVTFGCVAFALVGWGSPRGGLLSPWGWATFYFAISLVVCPLLIAFNGPFPSVLKTLPPNRTINIALVLMSVAAVSFAIGYLLVARRGRPATHRASLRAKTWGPTPRWLTGVYLGIGAVGMALAFRSLGQLLAYFTTPDLASQEELAPTQKAVGLAATTLRPFLGVGMIMVWCRRLDLAREARRFRDSLATATLLILALIVYGTYSYNRASYAVPAVAILAVYSRRVVRIRSFAFIALGAVGIVLLGAVGFYRTSEITSGQLLSRQGLESVAENLDLDQQIQAYGNGPQFLGFLLHNSEDLAPGLGNTTVSAALSPIPILGESFRESSGAHIYNRWIYGSLVNDSFAGDQVVPFAGELWLDLRLPGLIVGFGIVGAVIGTLQRRYERAETALEIYVVQFTAMWISFLIIGSVEVVSQILVFFFWPIYVLAGYQWLRRRPLVRRSDDGISLSTSSVAPDSA